MRLLLDTHILFWCLTNDDRLGQHHRELLLKPATEACVSAVSGWEIAVKVRLGKWPEAAVLLPGIAAKLQLARMQVLPLSLDQAELAGSLLASHKDPFDRLIAAQAIDLDIPLVTVDGAMKELGLQIGLALVRLPNASRLNLRSIPTQPIQSRGSPCNCPPTRCSRARMARSAG